MTSAIKERFRREVAEDRLFLQKLKPRLIKARIQGDLPTDEPPGGTPHAPSTSQFERPKARGSGPSPWLVVGASFAVGFALAKVIDWRGHAHPRR